MNVKQTGKYLFAVVLGFVLCSALNKLLLVSDRVDTPPALPGDQLVFLKWQKASVAAHVVRTSLRNDGLDVAIGSDDSVNALIVLADKQTTKLAMERIRDLDSNNSPKIN